MTRTLRDMGVSYLLRKMGKRTSEESASLCTLDIIRARGKQKKALDLALQLPDDTG